MIPLKKNKNARNASKQESHLPNDSLWQALKSKRLDLARTQQVPPYIIFHDSTLLDIHKNKPTSLEAFSRISGVGQTKLERYGALFIEVIFQTE